MRIIDKIANQILEVLEANPKMALFEIKKDEYLSLECEIADLISYQLKTWLSYDVDLNTHEDVEDNAKKY